MSEIIITTISKEEIQKFIESAVEKVMLQKSTKDNNQNNAFLDVDQAATFLGIAKNYFVWEMLQTYNPPF